MDIQLGTVARARRLLDRLFNGTQDDLLVDHLFLSDRAGDLQNFQLVGADPDGHVCLPSVG